jgi:hypothetical protein
MTKNPNDIWETGAKGSCASQTKVTVTVTDPAGVESVTLYWTVGGATSSIVMTPMAGDSYEAVLGAFKAGTVGTDGASIPLTATAIDKGGRSASSTSNVFLHSASSPC